MAHTVLSTFLRYGSAENVDLFHYFWGVVKLTRLKVSFNYTKDIIYGDYPYFSPFEKISRCFGSFWTPYIFHTNTLSVLCSRVYSCGNKGVSREIQLKQGIECSYNPLLN